MEQRMIFRERLGDLKDLARASGNILSEEEIHSFFGEIPLSDEHYTSIFQYLKEQGILIAQTEEEAKEAREQGHENALSYYLNELEKVGARSGGENVFDSFDIPAAELTELCEGLLDGDRTARDRVIEKYLPVVCEIVQEYEGTRIQTEDLIQEGNLGLLAALESMEKLPSAAAYQAYLYNGIRTAVMDAVRAHADYRDNGEKIAEKVNRLYDAASALAEERGHKVSSGELSEYLKMPEEEIREILKLAGKGGE